MNMSGNNEENLCINTNDTLNDKYLVIKPIGKYYKEVFVCKQLDNDNEVVIKAEKIGNFRKSRLESEIAFYRQLCAGNGFVKVLDDFVDHRNRYMVMNKMGRNLEHIFAKMRKTGDYCDQMILKSVVRYADEMISRVCNCHIRNIIHRDIKPENFVVDLNDSNSIYLIDFNLAKVYSTNFDHIAYTRRSPKFSVGNVMFLSINAHLGDEQSRRDDMLSLGYSLIYLAKGSLPWSKMRAKKSTRLEHMEKVLTVKCEYTTEQLCKDLPKQFFSYMSHCEQLDFEQQPNYSYLRKLFRDLLSELDAKNASVTDFKVMQDNLTEDNFDNYDDNDMDSNLKLNSSNRMKDFFTRLIKDTETSICFS